MFGGTPGVLSISAVGVEAVESTCSVVEDGAASNRRAASRVHARQWDGAQWLVYGNKEGPNRDGIDWLPV
jgi:hypothetical protein